MSDLAEDTIARASAHVPGLVVDPDAPIRKSVKCLLVPARAGDRALIVKAVVARAPVWRWYLARERAVLDAFAREPPPVRAPRIAFATPGDDLLVLDRMPGKPLAAKRHASKTTGDRVTWEALIAIVRAIRAWSEPTLPAIAPDAETLATMRARLLEDPTGPWIREGVDRASALGLLDARHARAMGRALDDHPRTAFAHGDLLLRNVLRSDDGALSLVDWECAGAHHEAWDAALLHVWAPSWARAEMRADYKRTGEAAHRAFVACAVFALVREIHFRRRRGAVDPASRRLAADRDAMLADLE